MHYLQVNYLMDMIMPNVQNGSTFKVISAVARQTWGYRRDCHEISFRDFLDMTGIKNKTTLSNAIQDAIDLGYIVREEWSNSFSYRMAHNPLAITNGTETVPLANENGTETVPLDGTETVPDEGQNGTETVPPSYMVKKEEKEKGKENPFPFRPNPTTPANVPEVERRIDEILAACSFKRGTPAHLNRAQNAAAQLQDVTPEEIKARYGRASPPNGLWHWYRDDWRGKKGEPPKPETILETIYYRRETAVSGQTVEEMIDAVDLSDIYGN